VNPPPFVTGLARVPAGIRWPGTRPCCWLAASAHRFVSRLAAARYLGYLTGQKAAMTGRAGAHRSYLDFWSSLP
jgi:hypothetical protein